MKSEIIQGHCLDILSGMEARSIQTCVTSPPYWNLRDYGVENQMGLEITPEAYIAAMVSVFREVRRVLKDDGTLWLNLGDSYNSRAAKTTGEHGYTDGRSNRESRRTVGGVEGLKPKDLVGIPWRVALALQADGWYLRQDIIWSKPNPMPESVTDRCTKSHEYVFLLSKNQRYYYDAEAITEPCSPNTHARVSQDVANQIGSSRANGGAKTNGNMKAVVRAPKAKAATEGVKNNESFNASVCLPVSERNKRSVWTVTTQPYKGAHFATFPEALITPCILAGSREGDTVLDPFAGSGTTAYVAEKHGRRSISIELNPEYIELIKDRNKEARLL